MRVARTGAGRAAAGFSYAAAAGVRTARPHKQERVLAFREREISLETVGAVPHICWVTIRRLQGWADWVERGSCHGCGWRLERYMRT